MNKQELIEELTNIGGCDAEDEWSKGYDSGVSSAFELANQLDEPKITEEQALNKLAESYPFSADGINSILQAQLAGYSPVSTMKFIQENESELPVIPQFVANWIESCKGKPLKTLFQTFVKINEEELPEKLVNWMVKEDNDEVFARAWLDGYTIEKESKQYVVKIGKGYFCGYDELKAVFILDDQPGSMDNVIKYSDKEEAESAANNIGGTVEPESEEEKTRQVLVKFFDSQEYKKELTEDAARELIEFLEVN